MGTRKIKKYCIPQAIMNSGTADGIDGCDEKSSRLIPATPPQQKG